MVEMGIGRDVQTVHGFRATARTILAEVLKYPEHIIDRQLAHVVKDPNGTAYNRTAFLDERRKMMQHWADYLDELRDGPEAKATRQQEEADRLHGEDDRERWARWAHEHPNEYAPGPDDHA
jgi:hypothetical protein